LTKQTNDNDKEKNMAQASETIVLEVLRVASTDVLGETKPLSVAAPCRFSNAEGHLKVVNNYDEIRKAAAASAMNFKQSVLQPY
jgi:hypothetical protein